MQCDDSHRSAAEFAAGIASQQDECRHVHESYVARYAGIGTGMQYRYYAVKETLL